jgi:hypothetical protein
VTALAVKPKNITTDTEKKTVIPRIVLIYSLCYKEMIFFLAVIVVFINLVASIAYFARVVSNAECTLGFLMLTHMRYVDYLLTCPFLVLDLLWNLEAPYKW